MDAPLDSSTPPWAESITPDRPTLWGGPGQLTRGQFYYLFRESSSDELTRARKRAQTWAEWEAFLAEWDAQRAQQQEEKDEEHYRAAMKRRGLSINCRAPNSSNSHLFNPGSRRQAAEDPRANSRDVVTGVAATP